MSSESYSFHHSKSVGQPISRWVMSKSRPYWRFQTRASDDRYHCQASKELMVARGFKESVFRISGNWQIFTYRYGSLDFWGDFWIFFGFSSLTDGILGFSLWISLEVFLGPRFL